MLDRGQSAKPRANAQRHHALHALSVLIGGSGVVIVGFTLGWLPALGIFLMVWGGNIGERADTAERARRIGQELGVEREV